MEKSAGKWNNAIWENLGGNLTTGAAGAGLGYLLSEMADADPDTQTIATLGGAAGLPLLSYLAGLIPERRTAEEQKEVDDSVGEAVADMLIPGYGPFNTGRRARARIEGDKEDLYNNLQSEVLGNTLTTAIPVVGVPISAAGAVAGLISPTRSKKEQDEADKDSSQPWLNMIPGVAAYQTARRSKADYK